MAVVDRARQAAQAQVEAAKALPSACLRQVFESEEAKRWPRKAFEEVAVLQRGYDLPSHQQVSGKYPVMTSSGMSGTHSQYKAKGPGVVTGRSGSIGRVHFVESHYWPHNTALFVREFKGNEPRYVFYLLQWLRLEGLSGGTGVPTLDRKTVHKVMVFHPDKERQLRIVAALDQQMSQAERLRQPAEARLEAVNALPGALLEQVFGGLEPPV
jgi:type I restriction enzyme S subunit